MNIAFTINGDPVTVDVDPETPLLWVLRDELKLTGTKFGCGMAQCGACTVHVNGLTRRSCVTPIKTVANMAITTVEGLEGDTAEAIKVAWKALDVPQCGYCQSGQIMSATALLNENRKPSDSDIDNAMNGNLCRCATYVRIRGAIRDAAKKLEA